MEKKFGFIILLGPFPESNYLLSKSFQKFFFDIYYLGENSVGKKVKKWNDTSIGRNDDVLKLQYFRYIKNYLRGMLPSIQKDAFILLVKTWGY